MSLIDQSFFIGSIKIPNLTGVGIVPAANLENLYWFMATYEPEYLRIVLGDTLYNAFIAGLKVVPIEDKWQNLRSKLIDSTNKISPIAGYVYYHIERDRLTSTSSLGQVKPASENSEVTINTDKMTQAFNSSVREGTVVRDWLSENTNTYPEYTESELAELRTINNYGI
jgi:hypothetical protein